DPLRDNLYRSSLDFVLKLNGVMGSCAAPWLPAQEAVAVAQLVELAERTIPYLPAEQLVGVVVNPAWQDCEHLPEAYQQALTWLQAAAQRDHQATETLTRQWLSDIKARDSNYQALDGMALAYLQLALIQQDKLDEAKAVEQTLGKEVSPTGSYGFIRSFLLAWLDE